MFNGEGFADHEDLLFARKLFLAICLTAPTFAFFFAAAGFVPLWYYLPMILLGGIFGLAVAGIHILINGILFYGISRLLTALVFRVARPPKARLAALYVLYGGLAILALSPVYYRPAHGHSEWTNIFGMFR
jgi:hypothetical protein